MAFLVVGLGRSGTKFLAETLNKSKEFTVRHETAHDGDILEKTQVTKADVQKRLVGSVGEVNHYLTPYLFSLVVDKKAVIIRDVRNVILSFANKWKDRAVNEKTLVAHKKNKVEGYKKLLIDRTDFRPFMVEKIQNHQPLLKVLDKALSAKVRRIDFANMISSMRYLRGIAEFLGVTDVPWVEVDIREKINAGPEKKAYASYADLPKFMKVEVEKLLWFNKKWKPLP